MTNKEKFLTLVSPENKETKDAGAGKRNPENG